GLALGHPHPARDPADRVAAGTGRGAPAAPPLLAHESRGPVAVIGVVTTSYPSGPRDPAGGFVRDRVQQLRAGGACVEVVAAGTADGEARDGDGLRGVRIAAPAALLAGAP